MPELETARLSPPRGPPFPWFCPRCRRKEVRPATIPYHGVRTYEGRDYTVDLPQLVVPKCSHCGELVFHYTAEEQIDQALQALVSKAGARGERCATRRSRAAHDGSAPVASSDEVEG